jgi:DNA (cytosine-5)-methyltransferase 1
MKLVSLFAGIGGFELAFSEDLGFEVIFANDNDRFACQTYRANFPNHKLIEGDIKEIDVKDIPPHDILVAGFPCQPFSHAGKQQGLKDKRGNLFLEIVRVLKYHKPN